MARLIFRILNQSYSGSLTNIAGFDQPVTRTKTYLTSDELEAAFVQLRSVLIELDVVNPDNEKFHFKPTDTSLVAEIIVHSKDSTSYKAYPVLSVSNFDITYTDDTLFTKNLYFRFGGITKENKFKIGLKESNLLTDFITLKAYVFPYINFVWLGLIIMAAGFIVSMARRANAKPLVSAITLVLVTAALFYMFFIAN